MSKPLHLFRYEARPYRSRWSSSGSLELRHRGMHPPMACLPPSCRSLCLGLREVFLDCYVIPCWSFEEGKKSLNPRPLTKLPYGLPATTSGLKFIVTSTIATQGQVTRDCKRNCAVSLPSFMNRCRCAQLRSPRKKLQLNNSSAQLTKDMADVVCVWPGNQFAQFRYMVSR